MNEVQMLLNLKLYEVLTVLSSSLCFQVQLSSMLIQVLGFKSSAQLVPGASPADNDDTPLVVILKHRGM